MSKFLCTCGHETSNVQWPCSHEAVLISAKDLDDHSDYSEKDAISRKVPRRNMVECAACGCLWIAVKPGAGPYPGDWLPFMPQRGRLNIAGLSEDEIRHATRSLRLVPKDEP